MTVKSGQVCQDIFFCYNAARTPTTPTLFPPFATLCVNGVETAVVVDTTLIIAGRYIWHAVLPTLSAGDLVSVYVSYIVDDIMYSEVVWRETADTVYGSELIAEAVEDIDGIELLPNLANLDVAVSTRGTGDGDGDGDGNANAGDAMALTDDERTTLVSAFWNALTSALTATGSVGKWIVDRLAMIDVPISSRTGQAAVDETVLPVRFDYAVRMTFTSDSGEDLTAAGSKLYLAIKAKDTDTDEQALALVEKTAGLTRLAQAAVDSGDASDGALTVTGYPQIWSILFTLHQSQTGAMRPWRGTRYFELKHIPVTGDPILLASGSAVLSPGIVRALS